MIIMIISLLLSVAGATAFYLKFGGVPRLLGCAGYCTWAISETLELSGVWINVPELVYASLTYSYTLGYLLVIFALATVPLATEPAAPDRSRPPGVTAIAALVMLAGGVGIAGALFAAEQIEQAAGFAAPLIGLVALGLVQICIGFALLVGRPWARALFFILIPAGIALDLFLGNVTSGMIVRIGFFAIGAYVLTRPAAQAFYAEPSEISIK